MLLSIIIPVRDRYESLCRGLDSIVRQELDAELEVLVVDDGSRKELTNLPGRYPALNLRVLRQAPLGIAAARNRGIRAARGELFLFVDSDCILEPGCLASLLQCCRTDSSASYQLAITGDKTTPAGILEHLRLTAVLKHLTADGDRIRFVSTSGFAVRRSYVNGRELFDTRVDRGEDTLVLAQLVRANQLPKYVREARIRHSPVGPLRRYVLKHVWIGFASAFARQELRRVGDVLICTPGRLRVLREIRTTARADGIASRWIILVLAAYCLECVGRMGYRLFGLAPGRNG